MGISYYSDLDNAVYGLFNMLETAGVFCNDRQVEELHIARRDGEGIDVAIRQTKPAAQANMGVG